MDPVTGSTPSGQAPTGAERPPTRLEDQVRAAEMTAFQARLVEALGDEGVAAQVAAALLPFYREHFQQVPQFSGPSSAGEGDDDDGIDD